MLFLDHDVVGVDKRLRNDADEAQNILKASAEAEQLQTSHHTTTHESAHLIAHDTESQVYPSEMSFDSPLPPYNASDPTATFLNSSCLDLLMIELVPMAYRIVNTVHNPSDGSERIPSSPAKKEGKGVVNGSGSVKKMDEDEERDAVFFRLEMLGYRVGQGLVERLVLCTFMNGTAARLGKGSGLCRGFCMRKRSHGMGYIELG